MSLWTKKNLESELVILPMAIGLLITRYNFAKIDVVWTAAAVILILFFSAAYRFFVKFTFSQFKALAYALVIGYLTTFLTFFASSHNVSLQYVLLILLASFPAAISIFNIKLAADISLNHDHRDLLQSKGLKRELILFSSDYVVMFFAVVAAVMADLLPWTAFLILFSIGPIFNNVLKFITKPFIKETRELALQNYWLTLIPLTIGIFLGVFLKK